MSPCLRPVALACLLLLPLRLWAATLYDPALSWRTVTTKRFRVHYHQGAHNLAVRAGRVAESVLDDVADLFGYTPEGPIDIVLVDSTDDANGSAQIMPKDIVRLYLAAPTELTGLSEYDDWLRILLVHELAHVCDLDQTWGLTRLGRWLFGKYVGMNQYTPQFLSEGVAVWAETLLTSTGRGRSSYVSMLLRTAALEGRFLDIDQAHVQFSDWPGPNAAYFYGGLFHLWLTEKLGKRKVRALHQYYAATPIPYLYWPGAKSVLGKSLTDLWDEWRAEETAFAEEVAQAVRTKGVTPSRRITHHGRNISGARYAPDGSFIVYSRTSPVDGSTVRRVGRDGQNDRHLVLETFSPRFSFSADGKAFYFSQSAVNDRFYDYNDLYRYDLATDEVTKLRDRDHPDVSLRARDPDISPDGKRMVFVQNRLQQSYVSVGEITGKKQDELLLHVLVPPHGDMQHASPRFSPDGRLVAVSTWFDGGKRDIILVDAHSGSLVRRITFDRALDGNPAWSPDGRYLLWESDADGISNIYAFELPTQRYFRVTRVIGGAFQPDVSRDGRWMLFRNASGIGFDIHEMPFAPASWQPVSYDPVRGYEERGPDAIASAGASPAWTHTPLPTGLPRQDEPPLKLANDESDAPYSPWPSLLPFHHNWVLLPAIGLLGDEPIASLTTVGADVLDQHFWSLSVGSGLYHRRLNWSAAYVNDSWYPTITVAGGDLHLTYGLAGGGRVGERRRSGAVSISLPVRERHVLVARYVYERRRGFTVSAQADGSLPRARDYLALGEVGFAELGYRYHLTRRFPYSVGNEHGGTFAVALRGYSRSLGSHFNELMLTTDSRAYLNNPLFDNHVLALRLAGALALGPEFREKFATGGAQGSSIISAQPEGTYPLRGFALNVDRYPPTPALLAAYAEYRLPLVNVERGLWTLPVYLERLHVAVFADSAATFGQDGGRTLANVLADAKRGLLHPRLGTGVELRADLSVGWAYPLTLRFGVGLPLVVNGKAQPRAALSQRLMFFSFGTAI